MYAWVLSIADIKFVKDSNKSLLYLDLAVRIQMSTNKPSIGSVVLEIAS